ncbi:MAG TPA: nucleotidyltransferase family protein [Microthrixaceae bacterium]|nr:nucleotidyltransferase family protein [Microthrixaceae bacterium]
MSLPAVEMMRRLAAAGLPGATALAGVDVGSSSFTRELIEAAESERLLGPLQEAVLSGKIELSPEDVELLVERQSAAMAWCLMIEVRLLEVRALFDRAGGVRHLVLKGPAVAHLDESDPAMRSFADLDLLVDGTDIDLAVEVLRRSGAERLWPQRRPGFDRRFAKSVTMTCRDGIEVDLHRTLCDGVHGARIPVAELFEHPDTFALCGEQIPTLSRPHRMMHALYHAVLGSPTPRLSSLRDIGRYLASGDLGPDVIAPVAVSWRGVEVVRAAVSETLDTLRFEAPTWKRWLRHQEINPRESARVRRQRSEGSSFGVGKLDMAREFHGLRRQAAYLIALAWPTSEHLEARGMGRRDVFRLGHRR